MKTDMSPEVTVLMPNYNNGQFLKEAIDSILNQSFSNFIFLIVDDGSTDNSVEIIRSYSDPRIRLIIKEKNSGIVDALNIGLENISTKYYIRMDGDDFSTPDRIELLYEFMEAHPEVGVCGSHMLLFGSKNETWKMELNGEMIKAKLIYTNSMSHAPSICRTDVLKLNNIQYANNHPYMEDYDLFFRLKRLTNFAHLDKVLYHYRILSHNSTVRNKETLLERKKKMFEQILLELEIPPTHENVSLHTQVFLGGVPLEFSVSKYRNWLNLLELQNEKLKIYPVTELHEFLTEAWRKFYFKLVPLSVVKSIQYFLISRKATYSQLLYLLKFKFNKFIRKEEVYPS